jgi:hypothetical protein
MACPIHIYKPVSKSEEADQCCICACEPLKGETWVQVKDQVHGIYHEQCLRGWLNKNPTDPQTREPLSVQELDHALANRVSLANTASKLLTTITSIWNSFCTTLVQLFIQMGDWISKKKKNIFHIAE